MVEIEHAREGARQLVERIGADPTQVPVVLDEAKNRGLVGERVIDEVVPREWRDHQQRQPGTVAASALVRPERGGRPAADRGVGRRAQYLDFRPLWERAIHGESDVTWPGRPRHWVKTSGTTAGEKYIPVTAEALASHRKGGWDALALAAERAGGANLLGGPMLFLGGSATLEALGERCEAGDLSGLVVRRLPPGIRSRYSPGAAIAAIPDWEERIAAAATLVERQDLRLLCGMPSWLLILFERVGRARELAGRPVRDLRDSGRTSVCSSTVA